MNGRLTLSAVMFVILVVSGVHPVTAAWNAGTAKAKITPQDTMWMAGYSARKRPTDDVLQDLWVRVLVLQDDQGNRGVIIALDLVGIGQQLSHEWCATLTQLGFKRDQIAICTSHTHSGPIVGQNLSALHYLQLDDTGKAMVDRYTEYLSRQVIQAVKDAASDMRQVTLKWGSGTATFAVNRRTNREADVPRLRQKQALKGPVDHDVPVLALYDSSQKLYATVFGYACHATVVDGYRWTGDYPGVAQEELEKRHPGSTALFWAGCGGDQNPLPRRKYELIAHYGERLANAVDRVLDTEMKAIEGPLKTRYSEVALPLGKLPTREQLVQDTSNKNAYVATRARMWLERIRAGEKLPTTYPYPIGFWQFGNEVEWFTMGGEVVVDYALRIKQERRQQATWVAGYAHDVMAYIPSRRVLTEGGYEGGGAMVYYGLPTIWHETVEQVIIEAVNTWK